MTTDRPVLLFAYANDRQGDDASYLRNLPEEQRRIRQTFAKTSAADAEIVEVPNATLDELFRVFAKYNARIALFHFGGHASPDGLQLEESAGSPRLLGVRPLADRLSLLPSLKLVVLNGCCTEAQVESIREAWSGNGPYIVATRTAILDDVATAFAASLYANLVAEMTIPSAFAATRTQLVADYVEPRSVQNSRMLRPGAVEGPGWPWLMASPSAGDRGRYIFGSVVGAFVNRLLAQLSVFRRRDFQGGDLLAGLVRLFSRVLRGLGEWMADGPAPGHDVGKAVERFIADDDTVLHMSLLLSGERAPDVRLLGECLASARSTEPSGPARAVVDDAGLIRAMLASYVTYASSEQSLSDLLPLDLIEPLTVAPVDQRQNLIDRYLEHVRHKTERLRLDGISRGVEHVDIPLTSVYVELRAVTDVPETTVFADSDKRAFDLSKTWGKPVNVRSVLGYSARSLRTTEVRKVTVETALEAYRGLVVLGAPGSGKSTLLRHLAWASAADENGRLPIRIPLAAFEVALARGTVQTLRHFLPVYFRQWEQLPDLSEVFDEAIADGRALLMLDGLDEVVDAARRAFVASQIDRLADHVLPSGNHVVVTSRVHGYRATPLQSSLTRLTLLPLQEGEIERFVYLWQEAMARRRTRVTDAHLSDARDEARHLVAEIRGNAGVRALAGNPLMLTLLALLKLRLGSLPSRRIRLYDEYMLSAVERWETARRRDVTSVQPARLDPHITTSALIELALWLQKTQPNGTASRYRILQQVTRSLADLFAGDELQAQRTADQFLSEMQQFAGVIVEKGPDAFGFRYLTFQEYFAARALARLSPEERFREVASHLHDPRWDEVIKLTVARLGISEQRHAEVSAFLGSILAANSPGEALFHRDLFTVAECLAEDVQPARSIVEDVVAKLSSLLNEPFQALSLMALGALVNLAALSKPGRGEALVPMAEAAIIEHVDRLQDIPDIAARLSGWWAKREHLRQAIRASWWSIHAPIELIREDPAWLAELIQSTAPRDVLRARSLSHEFPAVRETVEKLLFSIPDLAHHLAPHVDKSVAQQALAELTRHTPWLPGTVETLVQLPAELGRPYREAIRNWLAAPPIDDADAARSETQVARIRRFCLRREWTRDLAPPSVSVEASAGARHEKRDPEGDGPLIRLRELCREEASPQLLAAALNQGLNDPSAERREQAMLAFARACTIDERSALAISSQLDTKQGVDDTRLLQIAAAATPLTNFSSEVQETIACQIRNAVSVAPRPALSWLSSSGQALLPTASDVIDEYLTHPHPSVRSSAMDCLNHHTPAGLLIDRLTAPHFEEAWAALGALARCSPAEVTSARARQIAERFASQSSRPRWRGTALPQILDAFSHLGVAEYLSVFGLEAARSLCEAQPHRLRSVVNGEQPVPWFSLIRLFEFPDVASRARTDASHSPRQFVRVIHDLDASEPEARRFLLEMADHEDHELRLAALGRLPASYCSPSRRAEALTVLSSQQTADIRLGIFALAPRSDMDASVRQRLVPLLDHPAIEVRVSTAHALIPSAEEDPELRRMLWPAMVGDHYGAEFRDNLRFAWPRGSLPEIYARHMRRMTDMAAVEGLIDSDDFAGRLNGVRTAAAMGQRGALMASSVCRAMADHRDGVSWRARVAAARILLNHPEHGTKALSTIEGALKWDHGQLAFRGASIERVHRDAFIALGDAEQLRPTPELEAALDGAIHSVDDPLVRDAAWRARLVLLERRYSQELWIAD